MTEKLVQHFLERIKLNQLLFMKNVLLHCRQDFQGLCGSF